MAPRIHSLAPAVLLLTGELTGESGPGYKVQPRQQAPPSLPSPPTSHTPQDFLGESRTVVPGPALSPSPTVGECPDSLWSVCVTSGRLKSVKEVLCYSGADLQRLTGLPSHDVHCLLRAAALHLRGSRVLTGRQEGACAAGHWASGWGAGGTGSGVFLGNDLAAVALSTLPQQGVAST